MAYWSNDVGGINVTEFGVTFYAYLAMIRWPVGLMIESVNVTVFGVTFYVIWI